MILAFWSQSWSWSKGLIRDDNWLAPVLTDCCVSRFAWWRQMQRWTHVPRLDQEQLWGFIAYVVRSLAFTYGTSDLQTKARISGNLNEIHTDIFAVLFGITSSRSGFHILYSALIIIYIDTTLVYEWIIFRRNFCSLVLSSLLFIWYWIRMYHHYLR